MDAPYYSEIASRCTKHRQIPEHNLNVGGAAECGACIMAEVYWLFQSRLDCLETIAGLLQSHAEMRVRLAQNEHRLAFYEPNILRES